MKGGREREKCYEIDVSLLGFATVNWRKLRIVESLKG